MVYFHSSKCFWNYFSNKAKKYSTPYLYYVDLSHLPI